MAKGGWLNERYDGELGLMYAGVHDTSEVESALIERLGLRVAGPAELADSSEPVLRWLKETGAKHLAVHFELDVLDPIRFRSLLFAEPAVALDKYDGIAKGNALAKLPLLGEKRQLGVKRHRVAKVKALAANQVAIAPRKIRRRAGSRSRSPWRCA
ncbi:MAG: hypothetical protein ABJA77_16165, partial [Variovorax sp.]